MNNGYTVVQTRSVSRNQNVARLEQQYHEKRSKLCMVLNGARGTEKGRQKVELRSFTVLGPRCRYPLIEISSYASKSASHQSFEQWPT